MNTPHLIGNQLALGAMAAMAWIVHPPRLCSLAWLLAWPLTTITLLWWPQIGYAVGLSGVMHAGALVLAVHLLFRRMSVPKARRWGGLLALAMLGKLVLEQGWSHPVVWDPGNEMSVVQEEHQSIGSRVYRQSCACSLSARQAFALKRARWCSGSVSLTARLNRCVAPGRGNARCSISPAPSCAPRPCASSWRGRRPRTVCLAARLCCL
jgi:hypothetical protein